MIEVEIHVRVSTPDGIVKTTNRKRGLDIADTIRLLSDASEEVIDLLDLAGAIDAPRPMLVDEVVYIDEEDS